MNIACVPAEDSGPDGLRVQPPSMVDEWGVHRQVLVAYGLRSLYALPRGRLFLSVHSRSAGESFEEVNLVGLVGKNPWVFTPTYGRTPLSDILKRGR